MEARQFADELGRPKKIEAPKKRLFCVVFFKKKVGPSCIPPPPCSSSPLSSLEKLLLPRHDPPILLNINPSLPLHPLQILPQPFPLPIKLPPQNPDADPHPKSRDAHPSNNGEKNEQTNPAKNDSLSHPPHPGQRVHLPVGHVPGRRAVAGEQGEEDGAVQERAEGEGGETYEGYGEGGDTV